MYKIILMLLFGCLNFINISAQFVIDIQINGNIIIEDYIKIFNGENYITCAKSNDNNIFCIKVEKQIESFDSLYFYVLTNKDINIFIKDLNFLSENSINNYSIKIISFIKFANDIEYKTYIKKNKKKYNYPICIPPRNKQASAVDCK